MSEKYDELLPQHMDFITRQHVYFVGSASADGFVNVSPKGLDSLKVMSPNQLIWLNLTGSGNETAAHVLENSRMTIMFCSFETKPIILRVYGKAKAIYQSQDNWDELASHFPSYTGSRQIFDLRIELVQTSCGFAVPMFEFKGQRDTLVKWADNRGEDGIKTYWEEKNLLSLNGKKTGLPT